ncbi:glycoside hydrolase [Paenibacillus sp. MWE-103]|uniref:Glycoside hydrolase n=1 Tax=Paenibacillus artemisiicola TaxID=1172618 RepID=A0ABS3W5B2_9BACL|nr:glycoside hydrolase [Paenibacillus artemisiicola]
MVRGGVIFIRITTWTALTAAFLVVQTGLGITATANAESAGIDNMTKYRVYQNDKALQEFSSAAGAIAYARSFAYSHVEKTADRLWIWDDFPRYKVYANGFSTAACEFKTLAEAQAFAAKQPFSQIRDLEKPGWVSAVYADYRMYQGDRTLPNWSFATLAEAKKAAAAYGNVHIIELSSNQWVWDNLSDAQEREQRDQTPVYEVHVNGGPSGALKYGFLLDAIRASAKVPGSTVSNSATNAVVYSNIPAFAVLQNGKPVKAYYGLAQALSLAKRLPGAVIESEGREWWTNVPYLTVRQSGKPLRSFHTLKAAAAYAARFRDSAVVAADGRTLWSNAKELVYLGWNGTQTTQTVLSQVRPTQGLDYDAPNWFELGSADGTMIDDSDPGLVKTLRGAGTKLTPIVHNQNDKTLTSAFLRNPEGQSRFIASLVKKLSALGAAGVNLDFEMVDGADKMLYTSFVRDLTEAAHRNKLTVSIDLPRGDVKWDIYSAYDRAKLGEIVDTVVIMAYDQHWRGSEEAGSVAQLPWAEQGIKNYLAYGVPASKLMLGIPFYVRDWTLDADGKLLSSKAITMAALPGLIKREHAAGVYDSAANQVKYTYEQDGHQHVFWAETPDTVKARVDLVKKYGLAGIAAWRLGYESPDMWTMLLRQK